MIWLIFAHFIGDWAFQSNWIAQNKGKHWYIMAAHCMIWTACICIALKYTTNCNDYTIQAAAFWLFISHYMCDKWKCSRTEFLGWPLYVDQTVHLFWCFLIYTTTV